MFDVHDVAERRKSDLEGEVVGLMSPTTKAGSEPRPTTIDEGAELSYACRVVDFRRTPGELIVTTQRR